MREGHEARVLGRQGVSRTFIRQQMGRALKHRCRYRYRHRYTPGRALVCLRCNIDPLASAALESTRA
jgi:hypothetical protein